MDLVIKFSNKEAMEQFAKWLSHQGEQQYWDWMEYREAETKSEPEMTAVHFDYTNVFQEGGNVIKTRCGRLDEE